MYAEISVRLAGQWALFFISYYFISYYFKISNLPSHQSLFWWNFIVFHLNLSAVSNLWKQNDKEFFLSFVIRPLPPYNKPHVLPVCSQHNWMRKEDKYVVWCSLLKILPGIQQIFSIPLQISILKIYIFLSEWLNCYVSVNVNFCVKWSVPMVLNRARAFYVISMYGIQMVHTESNYNQLMQCCLTEIQHKLASSHLKWLCKQNMEEEKYI